MGLLRLYPAESWKPLKTEPAEPPWTACAPAWLVLREEKDFSYTKSEPLVSIYSCHLAPSSHHAPLCKAWTCLLQHFSIATGQLLFVRSSQHSLSYKLNKPGPAAAPSKARASAPWLSWQPFAKLIPVDQCLPFIEVPKTKLPVPDVV